MSVVELSAFVTMALGGLERDALVNAGQIPVRCLPRNHRGEVTDVLVRCCVPMSRRSSQT